MTTEIASVPLPPVDAEVSVICCEYCPVACGYKVYKWPEGTEGGRGASENALGVDFPTGTLSGRWPSQNMHTVIEEDGQATNVIIIPDADSEVVNVGGTHSVRGGALAKKLYTKDGLTNDRYLTPMLKVNGEHVPISWDDAIDLVARLSEYTLETWDELAWGFKLYSYQFYENVFAATKLVLGEIGTPNISPHHAPADGDDVPGLSDVGIDAFGSAFADDKAADVLFIAGSDPYETKTIRFTTWQQPGGATIIYVDPRKTFTAVYAEKHDGLHLQILPGTDTALYGAIAREIFANGWEDAEFIRDHMASEDEIAAEGKWRRVQFGRSFDQYREYLEAEVDFGPKASKLPPVFLMRRSRKPPRSLQEVAESVRRQWCCSRRACTGPTTTRTRPRSAISGWCLAPLGAKGAQRAAWVVTSAVARKRPDIRWTNLLTPMRDTPLRWIPRGGSIRAIHASAGSLEPTGSAPWVPPTLSKPGSRSSPPWVQRSPQPTSRQRTRH